VPEVDIGDDPALEDLQSFFAEIGEEEGIGYKLYRIERGKPREWLEDGGASEFSEAEIRRLDGAGTYMVRGISGREWIKSITIPIGAPNTVQHENAGGSSEQVRALELRLREIELRAESDRQAREQRNHELLLKMMDNRGNAPSGPSMVELVSAVKA